MAMDKSRSEVIFLFIISMLLWSSLSLASPLTRDGKLALYQSHLHEWIEVQYEKEGNVDSRAMAHIEYFMRSRDSGQKHPVDLKLIRLLDHLQDHFKVDTIEVISGFRTPEFNRYLRSLGRNTVAKSYHTMGSAADIHLDEISEKKLVSYLKKLKVGGVGYYPDNLMVHVDVGRVHWWKQDKFTNRRDIGVFNDDLNIQLKSNRLFYFRGQKQKLTFDNPDNIPVKNIFILEKFYRGKWQVSRKESFILKNKEHFTINYSFESSLSYGKYRWKLSTSNGNVQYSNEFYLKRL